MAKLGDFISPAKNIKCGDGKYPVLSMTMHDGIVLQSDRFKKSLASADQSGYKVVDYGQLVVGFPIDEGVLYLQRVIEQGIMSPAYNVWDVDYSHVDPSYFELSLHSPQAMQYYKENLRGSTARRRSLPKEVLLELPLKMPSMDEQKRVATSIDKLTHLIDMRSKQLDKLDELVKSRFIEMFGDPVLNPKGWLLKRFDSICENLDSQRIPIASAERKVGPYPYYGASGIVDYVENYIFDEDLLLISEDGANLVMRSTPIAFSISGKTWVNNHAHVVRFEHLSTQKYIEMCFELRDISDSITGSAQPKFNQAKLNEILFPLPPLDLQNQFADFVAQVDKSKLAVQKSLEQLEILKKSLMQAYFG